MKTLSPALLAELALQATRPGYLVEIGYNTVLRLSTLGDISYGGYTWASFDVRVSGIGSDGSASSSARLALGNTDGAFGALVFNEGAADIPVVIYACYAGASSDAVQVFSGVTNGADITEKSVTFQLDAQRNKTLYSPRVFISKPTFNFLQPAGTKIAWGGETFVLDR